MKSRDEIVIIMLQWLRLYTLGSRGSREHKTFLETRLISSRVDQNLRTKEGNTWFFKEDIGPKLWMMEAIVEAVFKRRGGASLGMGRGFKSAANRLEFRFKRKLQNRPRSSRDRPRSTTIERRSCSRFFESAA